MARLFGTNGIRWVVESHNPEYAIRLGVSSGIFFGKEKLAIGKDTRTSSPMIFNALVSGLLSTGCNVIDLGIVPTPLVQYAVKKLGLAGGLMVTASHNPPEFNGLMVFSGDGTEIPRADEERFENLFSNPKNNSAAWDGVGNCTVENSVQPDYKDAIRKCISRDMGKLTAVIDCANGAAIEYTPGIFTDAGCNAIAINSEPDGRFPGRMPEPVRENLGILMSTVRENGADMGVAHDGDADRATFVDETGNYVTGDQSLAIFAIDALKQNGKGYVVVPINTSKMVEDVVVSNGGKIDYTAVGSPLIARRMMKNDATLGGEGNGGVIFPKHQFCRDGIMAAARMLNIISSIGPLSNIVSELPKYSTRSEKIRVRPELKERILERVLKESIGPVNDIDGIKTETEEGWVLIRASGTEPIIRITVETQSEESCGRILTDRVNYLKELMGNLS
ncbi:MAG: phosphoglucosamine mutase [Euryarchaeota archaeon]|nr:phosphoglucosamine mutase [Euryarchaeota archaeon]MBU4144607.1 phosphoglucosamine mutase [Candidatus Thermoplasmatota archaeon]